MAEHSDGACPESRGSCAAGTMAANPQPHPASVSPLIPSPSMHCVGMRALRQSRGRGGSGGWFSLSGSCGGPGGTSILRALGWGSSAAAAATACFHGALSCQHHCSARRASHSPESTLPAPIPASHHLGLLQSSLTNTPQHCWALLQLQLQPITAAAQRRDCLGADAVCCCLAAST